MRRFALMALAVFAVIATLMLSRGITDPGVSPAAKEGFDIEVAEKNPWSSLKANRDPSQFQFAIVSDRTGAHRAGVFSRAVQQINLLQPEFVMSVGDLIEGSRDIEVNRKQWAEFNVPIELNVVYSPFRELTRPVLRYLNDLDAEHSDDIITVVIPEFVTAIRSQWLHNQSALAIKARLLYRKNTVVTSVPIVIE